MSKRILALGTTDHLRQQYGNLYHVHLVLKSTPTSTREEMNAVEQWVMSSFSNANLDPYGNHHGQVKFSVPAGFGAAPHPEDESTIQIDAPLKSHVGVLFSLLEKNRDVIGLQFYSIRATTMDEVFLNVVTENNVREEGFTVENLGKKHSRWCF